MTPVFYVTFRPLGHDGLACRWFILINKDFRNDEGLHKHERIHIQQMKDVGVLKYLWRYFVRHWMGDSRFRAMVEMDAFRYGDHFSDSHIIRILVDNYGVPRNIAEEIVD